MSTNVNLEAERDVERYEGEQVVIGAIILDWGKSRTALAYLRESHFGHFVHKLVFAAILDLRFAGRAIDVDTVAETLTRAGVFEAIGGETAIDQLCARGRELGGAAVYIARFMAKEREDE